MLFVNVNNGRPAYRWPNLPMPNCHTGHIAFGPEADQNPTLAEAIDRLPEYETTLWEAVRLEFLATVGEARAFSVGRAAHAD
ncbi:hypothetical protein ACFVMC_11075 [Nocardia sp. NPDC127579]|uniref:hypothetical protein n=1 Tax=Nocardia sp. NPDC127579 TaxID=3345402 RepID=UPI003626E183